MNDGYDVLSVEQSPNEAATNMDYLNIMTIHRPTDDELKQMQAALVRKQKQKIKVVTGKEPGTPVAAKAKPPSYEVQPALSSLRVIGKIL